MQLFLILALLTAIADWYVFYKGWKKIEYFLKPATMVFLFIFLFTSTKAEGIAIWFGIGIVLSMFGDIFLMLKNEQFLAGLVSFLLAHVAYIIGFNQSLPPTDLFGILVAVILGLISAQIYKKISEGLIKNGKEALLKPVFAYTAIIAIMLLSALLTFSRADWSVNAATTVSIGAALFLISDVLLAWTKFVQPIKNGRSKNLAAYHLGQIILIYGVVLHLS